MADLLRDRLQSSLGAAYTLERELGGGGMSRVFVARETALGRDVVVKVLAPDLAEGLSAERFAREVRLAAQLQEPHIVPLLAAGTTADGLPYYTMPYVAGESLRARRAAAACRSDGDPARRGGGARVRAQPRRCAPRRQAGERAARRAHGGGDGLRDRQGGERGA
jgi:hypothetical protein